MSRIHMEPADYRALKKILDCFMLMVPDNDGKHILRLRRLPTEKELQAAAEALGELEYQFQMDSLDRKRGVETYR